MEMQSVVRVKQSAYGNECCGGQQPGKDLGRGSSSRWFFGKEADAEVGHYHGTLRKADGQLLTQGSPAPSSTMQPATAQ